MFFIKLALPLAIAAPFASALTVTTPSGWTSGGLVTMSWQPVAGDPQSFTTELVNTAFHNSFGIANNVQTGALEMNISLPIVPVGDGYTLQLVNPGNISDIIAQSGDFSIGATTSTVSSSSTSASGSGSSSSASVASTISVTESGSSFSGVTVSGSSTGAVSPGSSGTNTATSSVGSTTSFSSGAAEFGLTRSAITGYAVMAAAAFAGARLVGF